MFIRRDKRNDLDSLHWRIRLFSIGAGLGVGGLWLDSSWLVITAVLVLVSGFALRFKKTEPPDEESATAE